MPEKFDFSKQQQDEQSKLETLPQEHRENFEQELSPEVIEMIMNKVQDIERPGIAFSVIKNIKFEDVIKEGLLGSYEMPTKGMSTDINKEDWAKRARKDRNSNVYFNITGRMAGKKSQSIRSSYWVSHSKLQQNNIIILFNISKFKEEFPIFDRRDETKKSNNHTYRPILTYTGHQIEIIEKLFGQNKGLEKSREGYDNNFDEGWYTRRSEWEKRIRAFVENISEEDKAKVIGQMDPDDENGFALSHRVSPRYFQGIVADFICDEDWESRARDHRRTYGYNYPLFEDRVKPYLKLLLSENINHPERLVPIYDTFGNLFWPQKMSHEEVKKFVDEIDKNKEKE